MSAFPLTRLVLTVVIELKIEHFVCKLCFSGIWWQTFLYLRMHEAKWSGWGLKRLVSLSWTYITNKNYNTNVNRDSFSHKAYWDDAHIIFMIFRHLLMIHKTMRNVRDGKVTEMKIYWLTNHKYWIYHVYLHTEEGVAHKTPTNDWLQFYSPHY